MLLTILVVLVILSLAGGAFGAPIYGPNPYARWSPLGVVLVVLVVLWLTGHLNEGPRPEHWRRW
jgi:hypothetical protein